LISLRRNRLRDVEKRNFSKELRIAPVIILKGMSHQSVNRLCPKRYAYLVLAVLSTWLIAALACFPAYAEGSGTDADSPLVILGTPPISQESYETFLPILLDDVVKTRLEEGNISFELFEPEDGKKDLLSVERWKNRAAFEKHIEFPYVKAFLEHLPTALREGEEQVAIFMKDLLPTTAKPIASPQTTKNIISVISVKQESVESVIKALLDVAKAARSEDGNLVYDVFQDISNASRLVVFQRWAASDAYAAHRGQAKQRELDDLLAKSLTQPNREIGRVVRDIGR
jgi:quinol monooxygenase YgiN